MKILAATDGSRGGAAAVRFAARLASLSRRVRLEVVMVGDLRQELFEAGHTGRISSPAGRDEKARIGRALRAAARDAEAEGARAGCRYVEAPGLAPIADAILDFARRSGADLIVAGSTGRGAVELVVFGSVARRLARHADRPLAIVPRSLRRRTGPLRILAATDGSPAASAAVRFAARLATEVGGGRLTIVHAATLRHDVALTVPAPLVPRLRAAVEPAEREAARVVLGAARRQAQAAGCDTVAELVDSRTPSPAADLIARHARRVRADAVVVGSEGVSALGGRLLGSVTRRLLRVSRIPVVVVPPGGKSSRLPAAGLRPEPSGRARAGQRRVDRRR